MAKIRGPVPTPPETLKSPRFGTSTTSPICVTSHNLSVQDDMRTHPQEGSGKLINWQGGVTSVVLGGRMGGCTQQPSLGTEIRAATAKYERRVTVVTVFRFFLVIEAHGHGGRCSTVAH